ncbi:MAG: cysteine desulfurase family protein [bacterium]|nr:cysteine desulfurase family protein [bacterium]
MKKIYLDYAAATPADPRVVKKIQPYFSKNFGNANSIHGFGREAKKDLEKSRKIIADVIKAGANEIIFTSSATESNNFALKGVAFANTDKGKHIIVSSVEHKCILEAASWLKKQGFKITFLPVDKNGLVSPSDVKHTIRKDTVLVSVMHVNNEIGTIEPIGEIGKICREQGVFFHTDAAQTFGIMPIDVNRQNIDLLTAGGQKIYGPKGGACLYIRAGVKIDSLLHGGGHEMGLRSATVNTGAVVGMALAAEFDRKEAKGYLEKMEQLRVYFIESIKKNIKDVVINGHPTKRLPNIINITFQKADSEALLLELDRRGIAVSAAAACLAKDGGGSDVLRACGLSEKDNRASIRFSLGKPTTKAEIDYVLKILPVAVEKIRRLI